MGRKGGIGFRDHSKAKSQLKLNQAKAKEQFNKSKNRQDKFSQIKANIQKKQFKTLSGDEHKRLMSDIEKAFDDNKDMGD